MASSFDRFEKGTVDFRFESPPSIHDYISRYGLMEGSKQVDSKMREWTNGLRRAIAEFIDTHVSASTATSTSATSTTAYALASDLSNLQNEVDGKQDELGYTPVNRAGDIMEGMLTLRVGNSQAGEAPIKFQSGPLLTSPEYGAVEFYFNKWYCTIYGSPYNLRKELTINDQALTETRVPYATTNGRLTDIAGFTFDGTSLTVTRILLGDGTVAAPTLAFQDDLDTGIYQSGDNELAIATAGVLRVKVTSGGTLLLQAGSATAGTAPLKFQSGTLLTTAEAGAMEFLTDKIYLTITSGAARKEITLNNVALTAGRVPTVTTNGRLTDSSSLRFDGLYLISPAFKADNGTAADPSYTFLNDPDTGIYSGGTGSNILNFTTAGVLRVQITAGGNLKLQAGSTAADTAPLKFQSGDLNTTAEAGAVEFLTDKIYFTITTGAARKEIALVDSSLTSGRVTYATTNGRLIDASNFTFDGTLLTVDKVRTVEGTISSPALQIGSQGSSTGIYSGGQYKIHFVTNSSLQMMIDSNGFIGLGGVTVPSYDLSIRGSAEWTIAMEQANSGLNGNNLILMAGAGFSGTNNRNGGVLYLKSGKTTGTGQSTIAMQVPTPSGSGMTLNEPATVVLFAYNVSTFSTPILLSAGSTGAGTAPLKFQSGSLNTTAEVGAVEFLDDKWYGTITTGAARKEFALADAALTSGRVPFCTTNGRLTDSSKLTFDGTTLTLDEGSTAGSWDGFRVTANMTGSGSENPEAFIVDGTYGNGGTSNLNMDGFKYTPTVNSSSSSCRGFRVNPTLTKCFSFFAADLNFTTPSTSNAGANYKCAVGVLSLTNNTAQLSQEAYCFDFILAAGKTTFNDPTASQIACRVSCNISGTDANIKKWAFYNNSSVTESGKVFLGADSIKTYWGTGLDISVYHDGTDSWIENITGILKIKGSSSGVYVLQATLGNEAFRIESTATNDDPARRTYQNRAATTDATVTTLHTITIPASTTVGVVGYVVARRTGGVAGTAEDGAFYRVAVSAKNVAGTATVIGAATVTVIAEDQAAWDVTVDATGATIRIRVTGAADNNITWHWTGDQYHVGS